MNEIVVDASAILAYLFEESGTEIVAEVLEQSIALISSVNYAEIVSKLVDRGMPEGPIKSTMNSLDLQIIPYDEQQAMITGLLRKSSRTFGLSLGDRACLALAKSRQQPVLTADSAWTKVPSFAYKVQLIR